MVKSIVKTKLFLLKFVKNQNNSKIGYLSKDVKVINDLIDDLSKLQSGDNEKSNDKNDIMTNPLEIDDKESSQSISSSTSRHSDTQKSVEKAKLSKDQVGKFFLKSIFL